MAPGSVNGMNDCGTWEILLRRERALVAHYCLLTLYHSMAVTASLDHPGLFDIFLSSPTPGLGGEKRWCSVRDPITQMLVPDEIAIRARRRDGLERALTQSGYWLARYEGGTLGRAWADLYYKVERRSRLVPPPRPWDWRGPLRRPCRGRPRLARVQARFCLPG